MKKSYVVFIVISLAFLGFGFILTNNQNAKNEQLNNNLNTEDIKSPSTEKLSKLDKIEVFLFHATRRCVSCINVGKYAKQTIDNNFGEEIESGKIIFKEINVDLPENYELTQKFQASGSSLFINVAREGKDNIEQDLKVWMLIGDEKEFEAYFKNKIENIIKS
jgi:hypothetical protein